MSRHLVPLAKLPEVGIPYSKAALSWIAFHREFNGCEKFGALVKVGGRLFADPQRFMDWMATGPQISPPGLRKQTKAA